jgi:hypothetical protein
MIFVVVFPCLFVTENAMAQNAGPSGIPEGLSGPGGTETFHGTINATIPRGLSGPSGTENFGRSLNSGVPEGLNAGGTENFSLGRTVQGNAGFVNRRAPFTP